MVSRTRHQDPCCHATAHQTKRQKSGLLLRLDFHMLSSCICSAELSGVQDRGTNRAWETDIFNFLACSKWYGMFSSVQLLSHDWLFVTHELQHTRPPCPSPTPGAYSNSCPLSRWCHPTISSSVVPFSFCLLSFSASGASQWLSSSHQVAKVLEFQLQHLSFQWIFRTDLL